MSESERECALIGAGVSANINRRMAKTMKIPLAFPHDELSHDIVSTSS